jgi:hypothetical protein
MAKFSVFYVASRAGQEGAVYELLQILLQKLNSEDTPIPMASHLATATLTLMTKLREKRLIIADAFHGLLQLFCSEFGEALPVDQLHSILHGLVSGILRPGTTHKMRGHLFAALINYLQYVTELFK